MSASKRECLAVAVGDEGVVVIDGEERELRAGVGRTRRTMSRKLFASFSLAKGV